MARANAARGTTHAKSVWAAHASYGLGSAPLDETPLRRYALLACGISLICFAAIVVALTNAMHDKIIADAIVDLEMCGKLVLREINDAIKSPSNPLRENLLAAVPEQALARGRRVMATSENGTVIAASPHAAITGATLADILGKTSTLRHFCGQSRRAPAYPRRRRAGACRRPQTADALRPPRHTPSGRRRARGMARHCVALRASRRRFGRPDNRHRRDFTPQTPKSRGCGTHKASDAPPPRNRVVAWTMRPLGLGHRARPNLIGRTRCLSCWAFTRSDAASRATNSMRDCTRRTAAWRGSPR